MVMSLCIETLCVSAYAHSVPFGRARPYALGLKTAILWNALLNYLNDMIREIFGTLFIL